MRSATLAVFALCPFARLDARQVTADTIPQVMFVNDEWERYVRVLQVAGDMALYPWSVRGFGLSEAARISRGAAPHPWVEAIRSEQQILRFAQNDRNIGRVSVTMLPTQVQTIFNSQFPFGYNDGPVWAGRGLSTVLQGGFAARAGWLTTVIAPVFFRAENTTFELTPNGKVPPYQNGDAFSAHSIDQPQRFGDRAYSRFDPGNSAIRLDAGPVAVGISTATQHWGPARDHPILLGNNAAGFPHVFLGTSRPVDVWFGKVHSRVFWGKLYSSQYTAMQESFPYRFATGLVGVLVPRGAPGLEIGGGRFFHLLWDDGVINAANLTRTVEGLFLLHTDSRHDVGDNQLASVFARWVFPESGFEFYGEYGKEDHNADARDLAVEPDHDAGYLLGFQRVWSRDRDRRAVLRGEVLNTRISGLVTAREQSRFYVHLPVAQGHTNLGQVLGSAGAFGGGASTLAFDAYTPAGRWTISLSRIMRGEDIAFPSGVTDPQRADVQHAVSVDGVRFRGRMAITYELTSVHEFNRYAARDAYNLRAASGLRYVW